MGEAHRARGRPRERAASMEQNLVTGRRCPWLGERAHGGRRFPRPGGRRPQEIPMGQRASHGEVMHRPSDSSLGGSEHVKLLLNTAALPRMPQLITLCAWKLRQSTAMALEAPISWLEKDQNRTRTTRDTASHCDAVPAVAEEDIQGPPASERPLVGVLQRTLKNPDELSNGGVLINRHCP